MMGRRALFDEMAARLATAQNWNVIVVEPFRDRTFTTTTTEERHAIMSEMVDEDVVGDLVEAADRLEVSTAGLMGFCMGGMYTFKAAASHRFSRLVSFYGMIRLPDKWKGPGQREPLALLPHLDDLSAVLSIIGTEDPYTPSKDVDDLEALGVSVARYEGAEHGFVHDAKRPAHRPKDAADAWAKAIQHLSIKS